MNRIQKILERRRKEFAPPVIEPSAVRASLPRELPRPVSAKASDKERTNTPN